MRIFEGAIFLSIATGLHMGIWLASPGADGAQPSGDAGQSTLSITPASAGVAQLVRQWQSPPDVTFDMAPGAAPESVTDAALPAPAPSVSAPRMAAPNRPALPEAPRIPSVEETPPAPPVKPPMTALIQPAAPARPITQAEAPVTPQARPAARPAPQLVEPEVAKLPQADTQAATPQPKARAKGAPTKKPAASGAQGTQQAAATQSAQSATLQAQWGARIQRKVHRKLFYPNGATGSGTTRVALTVDRNGRLQALQVIRSSGVSAFDDAALNAVRRAGRFPRAPSQLSEPTYRFTLGLTFNP